MKSSPGHLAFFRSERRGKEAEQLRQLRIETIGREDPAHLVA